MIAFKVDPNTLYDVDKLALETGLSGAAIRRMATRGGLRVARIDGGDYILGYWFLGYLDRISARTPEAPCPPTESREPSASPARKA